MEDFAGRVGRGILRAIDRRLRGKRRLDRRGPGSGYARSAHIERLEQRTLLSVSALQATGASATDGFADPAVDLVAATSVQPGELLLHFSLKDFSVSQQPDGTQQIVSSGLVGSGAGGTPELPGELVRLALPMDTDLSSVTLLSQTSQVTVVPGVGNLAPAPLPQTDDGQAVTGSPVAAFVDGKNTAVYGQDVFYGAPVATLASMQQMGRWKIAEVYYSPFQYNPVAGSVRITQDATLALDYQGGDPLPAALAADTNWDASAAQIIANPADAALWYTANTAGAAASSGQPATSASSGGAGQTFGPADSGVTANYVIITTAAIQAGSKELAAFVANQQARGFSVAVETESAWGGGTGNTAADNIRNWLQANYVSMGIQYVLLVGNPDPTAGDVPMKMTWPRYQESTLQQAPTDYYYADLTSNWDVNGDGKYGEWGPDFNTVPLAEVTVGRIPVYGADYASLDSILAKTIAYENDLNTAWRKSMLLPMAISNYADENNSGWPRTDGSSLGSYIQSDLAAPAGYSTYTMYEKAGLLPVTAPSNAPLTEANMVNQWSTTPYGIVDWWSHGNTTGAYRWVWNSDSNSNNIPDGSELSFTPFFTSSDTTSLNNSHPSIVVQVSCDNGDPQYSSNLGYSLLKQGAVATICASAYTFYSLGDWQPDVGLAYGDNASYAYYITSQLTAAPFGATIGAALQWTRENLGTGWGDTSWMNVLAMNLYGDPSLYLFPPAQIQGSVVNDVNGNGVRDAGEPGLSGQTVFLDDNNNGRIDSGTSTLSSGAVNLPIPDYGYGSLTTSQTLSGVAGAITNVTVNLDITHTCDSDLTATLVSPEGTQVQLFSSVGGSGQNFTNTTLSDSAATSITSGTAPFTGTFSPAQPLSALDGQTPNGVWQLQITDGSPGNVGTLIDWTLSISAAERSTTTDSNGNYSFSNLLPGTYHVRVVAQPGWQDTNPSSGEQDVSLSGGQIMSSVDFLVTDTLVNHAPQGTSNTVTTLENTAYTFAVADFGFSDPYDTPPDALLAVEVTTLPAAGSLTDNAVAVMAGQFVSAADINSGKLVFMPVTDASGTDYASFTFQVQDNGGTANGGVDLDPLPKTMTVDVTVSQTLTSITVAPTGVLSADGTQQFAATALDQFGNALLNQPDFVWSVIGSGTISSTGVFTPPYGDGSGTVVAKSGSISGQDTVAFPGPALWNSAVDSSWSDANSWTIGTLGYTVAAAGVRGIVGDIALFDGAVGLNADLGNVSPSIAGLTFGPSALNYDIKSTGSGVLQLDNGVSNATIIVSAGSQTIEAPIQLVSNTTIDSAASATLNILGSVISDTGTSLTIGDATHTGTLAEALTGSVSVAGATNIPAGTLQVDGTWTTAILDFSAPGGGQGSGQLAGSGTINLTSGEGLYYDSTATSTFGGNIMGSASDARLQVAGGSLTLNGANNFQGGTTVSAGTLILANSSAIAAGTSLTIGADATSIFTSSLGANPAAVLPAMTHAIASSANTLNTPAAATSETASIRIRSQVQDFGGLGNGGADLDLLPRTVAVNVAPLNDPPQGTSHGLSRPGAAVTQPQKGSVDGGTLPTRQPLAGALSAARVIAVTQVCDCATRPVTEVSGTAYRFSVPLALARAAAAEVLQRTPVVTSADDTHKAIDAILAMYWRE